MFQFLIVFGIVILLMVVCKAASNAIGKAHDAAKDARDRQAGAYQESKPQNLSDRFK